MFLKLVSEFLQRLLMFTGRNLVQWPNCRPNTKHIKPCLSYLSIISYIIFSCRPNMTHSFRRRNPVTLSTYSLDPRSTVSWYITYSTISPVGPFGLVEHEYTRYRCAKVCSHIKETFCLRFLTFAAFQSYRPEHRREWGQMVVTPAT